MTLELSLLAVRFVPKRRGNYGDIKKGGNRRQCAGSVARYEVPERKYVLPTHSPFNRLYFPHNKSNRYYFDMQVQYNIFVIQLSVVFRLRTWNETMEPLFLASFCSRSVRLSNIDNKYWKLRYMVPWWYKSHIQTKVTAIFCHFRMISSISLSTTKRKDSKLDFAAAG